MNYELKDGRFITDECMSALMEKVTALDVYHNPDYTWDDIGTSMIMSDVYGENLRYCPQNDKWYLWDARWCRQDDEGVVMDMLQTLLNILIVYQREIEPADDADEEHIKEYSKYLHSIRKFRQMVNILETLKTVLEIRINLWEMDTNPYLINTPGGQAYNLKTGKKVEDIRQYNVTKLTSCSLPDFTTKLCSRWYEFIDEIMSGDKTKAAFLQRALGYSMLGVNREECMFMAYGSRTRNGKGTLFSTISTVLGSDYVGAAPPDLICENKNGKGTDFNAPQPALAKLVGVRLVRMSESPREVRLDAASMKTMTGRDTLTTRDLYKSSFDFVPQFTLWLETNHLPLVTDETVFSSNRIWVIEFNEHFEGDKQDKDLKELFVAPENRPTILQWLYDGCQSYLKHGLEVPPCVRDATERYRRIHDRIGGFIEDCCAVGDDYKILRGNLYTMYRKWCSRAENSYKPIGSTSFYGELDMRGYPVKRLSDGWYVTGIKIKEG